MRFQIYGPFSLYRYKGLIDSSAEARSLYWGWVDDNVPGLPDACGCYVFSIKAPRGSLPWYIGKAEKQPFKKECLTHHKINHFNNAIVGRKGRPEIYFIPQITNTGVFRKPTKSRRKAIIELESLLIGMAISRNPQLLNIKGTKILRELVVEGFINDSRKAKGGPAADLRKLLDG